MLKDEMSEVSKNFEREVLLEKLLLYFKMHMPGFPELNTVSVLKNLLH
jgi:hypothetical protein